MIKKELIFSFLALVVLMSLQPGTGQACTSFLVTPGASADGSTMISYAADSHIRYGELYFTPGGPQAAGSFYQACYRGSHKPLAQIPQVPFTYTVIGFMNEKQVAIGETTFSGRKELKDPEGMIDYGSLMFLALQRAATARQAIRVIVELTAEYGYYGDGESFSIADPREAWIMEISGKGSAPKYDRRLKNQVNRDKGAVWVAMRIPDGYISAHANHPRITTFPLEDRRIYISSDNIDLIDQPEISVVYAADVISFARRKGYFQGRDEEFSFSDVYAPLDFGAARFCEARVWSFFRKFDSSMDQYEKYAMGYTPGPRMPLYVKPERKLAVEDLITCKRDHLQDTAYDMTADLGAGPFGLPYRWRPLTWKHDGKSYFHERTTATQQTAFSFIAQLRSGFPDPIGGIKWFAVDDTNTTVYVPIYAGLRRPPQSYAEGNGSILEYSESAAFWVFNQVAHLAYLRYDLILPDIRKVQQELEGKLREFSAAVDQTALELHSRDPELARDFLTEFSVQMADRVVERWRELYRFLLVKFLDGNIKKEQDGVFLRNEFKRYPLVEHLEYPDWWKELLIRETGDKFLVPEKKENSEN